MKKIIILCILITLLGTVSAQTLNVAQLSVNLLNQDPDPVNPGEYVELRFSIQNQQANTIAKSVDFELVERYPFTLDPSEKALRPLGDLAADGPDNARVLKYRVRVADDAVEGENKITVRYRINGQSWISKEVYVSVQTRDPNLGIVSVETIPEVMEPGSEALLAITVQNLADSTLRDITMKLDLTYEDLLESATTKTATDVLSTFNALPFVPKGSATEQKIPLLNSGATYTFTYNLVSYPDAVSKVYKVPITVTYFDELETLTTKNDIIGVTVGATPELRAIIEETDLRTTKSSGAITLRFINKGVTDIKFLDVNIEETDEFQLISPSQVYVGNVDSDDYETAEYSIYLSTKNDDERTITVPVSVTYQDPNNNRYEKQFSLSLDIVSPEKMGESEQSSPLIPILLVLIVIGIIVVWRRRRKKK